MKVIKTTPLLRVGALLGTLLLLGACGGGGGADGAATGSGVAVAGTSETSSASDDEKRRNGGGGSGTSTGGSTSGGTTSGGTTTGGTTTGGATAPELVAPTVPVATTGALSGDVVNSSGQVVTSAYTAMAAKMSTAEGITYRYGAASTKALASNTWYQRADNARSNPSGDGRLNDTWQVGGPETPNAEGDYFTNIGSALYVADNPAARVGVADFQTIAQRLNTFVQKPQWAPALYGEGEDDGHALTAGGRNPVASARCYGRPQWCLESVVAYQNGLISTAMGSNTSQNFVSLQLPAGKVPTAVTLSNASEFAFVTVWDTATQKGQIAVIALAGLCNGCTWDKKPSKWYPSPPSEFYDYWGEWGAVYPGLANLGNIGFMKLLGFVDLPEGLRAPTEIAVTTGFEPWKGTGGETQNSQSGFNQPLNNASYRQTFISGVNQSAYAKGGVAIVLSKSEKRAAFIDLKPLFAYYASMYFGTQADFDKTANVGMADAQWPYAFTQMPATAKPKLVALQNLDAKPTAVKASLWGPNIRGWIATEEGKLRIFNLGGLGDGTGIGPVAQVGSVTVGANPTSIAYPRYLEAADEAADQMLVLSRTDRSVNWVKFAADRNSGTIAKTLTDSRIVDPIMIEDNENHGTSAPVVTMADYGAKKIRNYRWGPVVFWTNQGAACANKTACGLGPNNQGASVYPFEYGGDLTLQGKPFFVSSSNVP